MRTWHRCQQIDAAKSNSNGNDTPKGSPKDAQRYIVVKTSTDLKTPKPGKADRAPTSNGKGAAQRKREKKPSSTLTRRTCVLLHWPKKLAYPQEDS